MHHFKNIAVSPNIIMFQEKHKILHKEKIVESTIESFNRVLAIHSYACNAY